MCLQAVMDQKLKKQVCILIDIIFVNNSKESNLNNNFNKNIFNDIFSGANNLNISQKYKQKLFYYQNLYCNDIKGKQFKHLHILNSITLFLKDVYIFFINLNKMIAYL